MKPFVPMFLTVLSLWSSAFGGALEKGTSNKETPFFVNLNSIPRDQPRITRIFKWDHRIVVEAQDLFYKVDVENQRAIPLFAHGGRSLVAMSGGYDDINYALSKSESGFFLLVGRNGKWDHLQLPDALDGFEGNIMMLANREYLVIITDRDIYKYLKDEWKHVFYKRSKQFGSSSSLSRIGKDDHLILFKDKIFVGHDWGEFGGGLVSLDINSGKWEEHLSGTPVTGLAVNAKGELWASQGVAHMWMFRGILQAYDGKSWRIVAENSGRLAFQSQEFADVSTRNWPFHPAEFDGLTFDGDDDPIVLSGSLGILRYSNNNWTELLRMAEHTYVSAIHIVDGNTVLIGTYDSGIIAVDLATGEYKRIVMAETFYE